MFSRVFLVTGPSGAGKTTLFEACVERAEPGVRQVDMDDLFSSSDDGLSNRYDIARISHWIGAGQDGGVAIMFGLSRNILQVIRSVNALCARRKVQFVVLVLRPGSDTIVRRRLSRGKAFDKSLDEQGHRADVSKFDKVLASVRTHSLKRGDVDELMSFVFRGAR